MSNDPIPTFEQSSVLAELVHRGELTHEHRYMIARDARNGPAGVIS